MLVIFVTCLPSNIDDMNIDSDSYDIETAGNSNVQLNSNQPVKHDCTAENTSTPSDSDETVDNDQNLNIVKRSPTFCPADGSYRNFAPDKAPEPLTPDESKNKPPPDQGCPSSKPLYLRCGGYEVWFGSNLAYVMDCVRGEFFFFFLPPPKQNS